MADPARPLWVVTSYFNPAGSLRRRDNYRIFRERLNAPLLTVELAGPGAHQLCAEDAEILVSLEGEPFLWQKERLINIGISRLPRHVEFVAWVDCDVVFERTDWPDLAARALERESGLLHLFSRAVHLPRAEPPMPATLEAGANVAPLMEEWSLGHAARRGEGIEALRACYDPASRRSNGDIRATGMALAARRESLEACGLYDAAIIGGGDSILMCAALDLLGEGFLRRQANPFELAAIGAWAARAREAGLFRSFGDLPQAVFHLWHGDLADRQYGRRHRITSALNYDPSKDVRHAANGTWEWAEHDGPLARAVRDYFLQRRDDGPVAPISN